MMLAFFLLEVQKHNMIRVYVSIRDWEVIFSYYLKTVFFVEAYGLIVLYPCG